MLHPHAVERGPGGDEKIPQVLPAPGEVRRGLGGEDDAKTNGVGREHVNAPRPGAEINNLAWLLAMQKRQLSEALAHMDRLIDQVVGPHSALLDTRAMIHLAANRPNEAIEDLLTATDDKPSFSYYFHLAQAYLKMGDRVKAREAFQNALRTGLNPELLHPLELPNYEATRRQLTD